MTLSQVFYLYIITQVLILTPAAMSYITFERCPRLSHCLFVAFVWACLTGLAVLIMGVGLMVSEGWEV